MRRLTMLIAVLCALAVPAAAAGPALAATHAKHHAARTHARPKSSSKAKIGDAVINDCQAHGVLTKHWSKTDLHDALDVMSTTTKQYSDCSQIVQDALAGKATIKPGSGKSSGGSSSSTLIIVIIVVVVIIVLVGLGLAIRRRRTGDTRGGGPGDPPTQPLA